MTIGIKIRNEKLQYGYLNGEKYYLQIKVE